MRNVLGAVLLVLCSAAALEAQPAIFVVRHAERADTGTAGASMMAADPDLSTAGVARAESLAAMLKDARITAIYTTEYKRTKQTAAPLAKALRIEAIAITSKDTATLGQKLKGATGNVLVVGHSNTIPAAIEALGVTEPVTIGESDFDNLFVVIRTAPPKLVRLHYR